jgi:hypothetical protein
MAISIREVADRAFFEAFFRLRMLRMSALDEFVLRADIWRMFRGCYGDMKGIKQQVP